MFNLAIRNILRQKGRFAITLAAIVFGVVALIISGGFVADVFIQLREVTIHSQLGHIQIHKAGYNEYGKKAPYDFLLDNTQSMVEKIEQLEPVKNVLQRVEFSGLLNKGTADLPIIGQGVEPLKENELGTFMQITKGRRLEAEDTGAILVGQGLAGALLMEPGDSVYVMVNTPDGALNSLELEVVGIFQTFSKDFDDRAVQIPLLTAQELLSTESIHMLVLHLNKTEDTESLAAALERSLKAEEFDVHKWDDLADFYRSTVALYDRQFGVLQLIVLLMVLLGVGNSVNMAIFERTGEFGTQMAVGDPARKIFRLILLETAILGVIGSLLGLVLGVFLAWAISQVGIPMPPPPNSNTGYTAFIRIVPNVLITACVVGFLASVIAAILPARRTSRMSIIDALRENI